MNITCGTDIIEVARVEEAIKNLGNNFLNKIYTKTEIEYCQSKGSTQYQHFAARFAAKEAIFKAISPVLKNKYEITWTDAEIYNTEDGRPYVRILNKNFEQIEKIDISLSHLKEYAVANCVIVMK